MTFASMVVKATKHEFRMLYSKLIIIVVVVVVVVVVRM